MAANFAGGVRAHVRVFGPSPQGCDGIPYFAQGETNQKQAKHFWLEDVHAQEAAIGLNVFKNHECSLSLNSDTA